MRSIKFQDAFSTSFKLAGYVRSVNGQFCIDISIDIFGFVYKFI